eukprot:gene37346-46080_t
MMETVMARSVRLIFSGSVVAAGLLAAPAMAQDAGANVQRVEITGSSIKRATAETASPIQLIGREELLKSGKATVAEYLQTLTVDGAGSLPTGFGNGFAAGSTAISLRGLGATSTLVLLNGRRMAPFARADDGQKSFTDLSTVPMQIVERIEILKDGASSTYGADAIAGVVNIILRKDFEGLQVKADTGASRYSDAKQNKASVSFGKGNLDTDKYNFVLNAEYMHSDSLKNSDRGSRGHIGHGDLRPYGFPVGTQFAGGYIAGLNNANAGPAGSIRNPVTTAYTSLPGCSTLSDEGALVASHGRMVAEAIEALTEALGDRKSRVSGHLRVAAPHGFGRLHVAPVAEAFARAHEGVTISLELSDHPGAQVLESCDVVVHIGPPGPLSQVVTTLAPNRRLLCASPAYLEQNEAIAAPEDLARHRCLVVRENDEDVTLWRFSRRRHEPATVRIRPAMSSNDGAVVRDWALAGLGIAIRSEWHVAEDLAQGRLRQV